MKTSLVLSIPEWRDVLFDGAFVKHSRFKGEGASGRGEKKKGEEGLAVELKSVILETM